MKHVISLNISNFFFSGFFLSGEGPHPEDGGFRVLRDLLGGGVQGALSQVCLQVGEVMKKKG